MSDIVLSLYKFKKQIDEKEYNINNNVEDHSYSSFFLLPQSTLIKDYQMYQFCTKSIISNILLIFIFLFCIIPANLLYIILLSSKGEENWIIHLIQLFLSIIIVISGILMIYFKFIVHQLIIKASSDEEETPPPQLLLDRPARLRHKATAPNSNLSILSGISFINRLSTHFKKSSDNDGEIEELKAVINRLFQAEQFQYLILVSFIFFVFLTQVLQCNCIHSDSTSHLSRKIEHFLLRLFGQCSSNGDDVNMNVLVFMFIPYVLTLFYSEIYLEWHLFFHVTSMILCFIALSITTDDHEHSSIIYAIISGWLIIGVILLYEHYYQHLSIFLMAYRNQQTIEEKDRDADRRSAAEMRHMIGNVAHDLKTPLSSFTTGLEVITDILDKNQDIIERLKNPELCGTAKNTLIQEVEDSHSGIEQCLKNIQDTNTFMLMTINRCIDYTKASRGFKLVPKNETVDLLETLRLPLDCMKNIQERISIRLFDDNLKVLRSPVAKSSSNLTITKPDDPNNPEICSHIITDKQWLQENILCLLSNAVKYSNGGEVTIRVYLIPSERLPIRKAIIAPAPAPSPAVHNGKYPLASPQKFTSTLMKHMSFRETVPMLRQMTVNHLFPQPNHKRVLPTNRYFEESHHPHSHGISAFNSTSRGDEEDHDMTEEPTATTRKKGVNRFSLTNADRIDFHLRFDIEDTGIGMSTEAMNQLFNPFRQAQRLAGGTGLGLYSLAKRMEALNGCYGVSKRSDGKQGSLFWFSIPYKPDQTTADLLHAFQIQKQQSTMSMQSNKGSNKAAQRKNSIITIPIAAPTIPRGKSRRLSLISPVVDFDEIVHNLSILLVEDAPSIAKMSSMLLRRMGHTVVCAENGEVALKKVQEQWETHHRGFDLILMDLQMPVMDGLEATRRLRELEIEGRPWLPALSSTDHNNTPPGKADARRSSLNSFHHPSSVIRAFTSHFSMISSVSSISEVMNVYHHAVVGVSANSDDETVNDAMTAGLDAFMPKPFTNDVFNTTVLKVLQSINKR